MKNQNQAFSKVSVVLQKSLNELQTKLHKSSKFEALEAEAKRQEEAKKIVLKDAKDIFRGDGDSVHISQEIIRAVESIEKEVEERAKEWMPNIIWKRPDSKHNQTLPTYLLDHFFDASVVLRKMTANSSLVLKTLASYRGADGCYPSHQRLADDTGLSEKTVRRTLNEAKKRGWISWINEWRGLNRKSSNQYSFHLTPEFILEKLKDRDKFKEICSKIRNFLHTRSFRPRSSLFKKIKDIFNEKTKFIKDLNLNLNKNQKKKDKTQDNNGLSLIQQLCMKYKNEPDKLKMIISGELTS